MHAYKRIFSCLSFCLFIGHLFAQNPFHSSHKDHTEQFGLPHLDSEVEYNARHSIVHTPRANKTAACTLEKKVYGWHPYWMGTAYTSYDFNLLSTFAYFSYEVDPSTGDYTSIHSWKTTNSVNLAHAAGCAVELSVTNFGSANNTTLLSSTTSRQRLIDSLIVLVQYRNAEGVNIDFEGVPGSQRVNFTAFMQDLSTQLKGAIPGATVSMALYAVDWNNVFDIPNLDPYVDQFIIMGYDYHGSWSTDAGPTAPLYSGGIWYPYDLTRSVLYYLGEGATPEKLLIGLPYYGPEYNTAGSSIPSANTGYIGARLYNYMRANYDGVHPRTFDAHSQTPDWIWQVGTQWKQGWVDDVQSLGEKFDLVFHKNIGGIGIWALGYDNGYTDLWNLIETKFSDCGPDICADTLYDTGGPMGNYRDNEDYTFTIQSPAGQQVQADFNSFDVELNYDYLYVHDGPTTGAPLIQTLTGTTIPSTITSSGDALTFRFDTDGATVAGGFELAWQCVGPTVYNDTIWLNRSDSANLNCGLTYHQFYDSDAGTGGNYLDNEDHIMTFCADSPADAVRLSFAMTAAPIQLDMKATGTGNDYLYFYDGPDTTGNLVGLYTGSTSAYPQPGTYISSDQCMTVRLKSDGTINGAGWDATLRCATPPVNTGTTNVSSASTATFEDTGGASTYGNNENYRITFCPDASATAAGEVVWAIIDSINIEQNYDYLHVFDGADMDSRLICTYTGNGSNGNNLRTIKATEENTSGCLTFVFYSDGATVEDGWSAIMSSGKPRHSFGTDYCMDATLINIAGEPYAGSTALATGTPGTQDPALNISLASLPECSGTNTITHLDNTVWYKFTTPSSVCTSSSINFELENISCQNTIVGGNGIQFVLYEANSCLTGSGWGTPVYCADKLLNGASVNVASLLNPSQTYYIMLDGFAGQRCNFDLILTGDIDGCILPIELVDFSGQIEEDHIALSWVTANEHNNSGFYIQRKGLGVDGYQDIGYAPSVVPEGGGAIYDFNDYQYYRKKSNLYRLHQVDLDGHSHYHKVIVISPQDTQRASVQAFPNPFSGELHLLLSGFSGGHCKFEITDISGRIVEAVKFEAQDQYHQETIEMSELAKGVYFYTVTLGTKKVTGKVIKQ